jgi:hypothetical protein
MDKLKTMWQRPIVRIGIAAALIIVLGGGVGCIFFTQLPPPQPINFPHSFHVGVGAQCLYCHPGAASGPVAGLPTTSKCWGCHQQIKKPSAELDKLASFVSSGKPIPWVPVAIQPDYVHFSHQPHIAARVSCETCHGEVAKMKTAQPQPGQNMGWCLDCHKHLRPQEYVRLSDCSICHY